MSHVLGIRLSGEERDLVLRAAAIKGQSASDFGKSALLAAAAGVEPPRPSPDLVPQGTYRDMARWLAEELADAAVEQGITATVSEAQNWFTVAVESASQAAVIVRYGKKYLRPLFTMPETLCIAEAESGRWASWMTDSSSHVRRDGPTFRSPEQLSASMAELRAFSIASARHVGE